VSNASFTMHADGRSRLYRDVDMRRALSTVVFCVLAFAATLAVQAVWSVLLAINLRTTPAVPWSVGVTAMALWVIWEYAGGRWAPARTRAARARYRKAGALPPEVFIRSLVAGMLALGALITLWIVLFQLFAPPARAAIDGYPPLTIVTVITMASVLGAVIEELGLRGYMLTRLQQSVPGGVAVLIVALAIVPGHAATQGFSWPVVVWYLAADIAFGMLAWLSGSIRPGIVVHAIGLLIFFTLIWPGDLSRTAVAGDALFWGEVVLCLVLGAASVVAFADLGRATYRDRAIAGPSAKVVA